MAILCIKAAHIFRTFSSFPICKNNLSDFLGLKKQPPKVFYKKEVLKNFAKFTAKHLCQSLFLNKVVGVNKNDFVF